jgi:recombination protein RecR
VADDIREIEALIGLMAQLPGLGPRSARRAVLHLLGRRAALMTPLAQALARVAGTVQSCSVCGNLGLAEVCAICRDPGRDGTTLCVVEDVADLWAMERAAVFRGRYHVLGGVLSALDGIGPDDLRLPALAERVRDGGVTEVILALGATVDGQTTAHYIAGELADTGARVTTLGRGVPMGGELDYLDDGTIMAALKARQGV